VLSIAAGGELALADRTLIDPRSTAPLELLDPATCTIGFSSPAKS
jgi:hypothetical protein